MPQNDALNSLFGEDGQYNLTKLGTGLLALQVTPDNQKLILTWIPQGLQGTAHRAVIDLTTESTGPTGAPGDISACIQAHLAGNPQPGAGDILRAMGQCFFGG